jgi:hypothetical protein
VWPISDFLDFGWIVLNAIFGADLMPVPKKTKRCRAKLLTTTSWIWGQQQEDAFQQLKRQLQYSIKVIFVGFGEDDQVV